MLLPLHFPDATMRRLKKLFGKAPTTGNLKRADWALDNLWLRCDMRAGSEQWSIRFPVNDPHGVTGEFWIECPDACSKARRYMMRTILVCAVYNGTVPDITVLYRIAHQTRERIAALTTAPATAQEPSTPSVPSIPSPSSVNPLVLALRAIAALPPENPTSIYRARMLANDQLRELANA